jgi:hypothetical protein
MSKVWAPAGAPNDPTGINDPSSYSGRINRMTGLDLSTQILAFSDAERELLYLGIMTVEGDPEYYQGKVETLGYWKEGTMTETGTPC